MTRESLFVIVLLVFAHISNGDKPAMNMLSGNYIGVSVAL